jgi:hypothetical protein
MIATRQKRIWRRPIALKWDDADMGARLTVSLTAPVRWKLLVIACAALVQLNWVLFFLPGSRYAGTGFILMD